ncbi:cryptochrome-1 [Iris pallida]|uniref:Cryptochrome-1 n=1 Tax=Iris pallida TaxID=29817 RepID=A0AAX6FTD9_IRIPA|nr:cryptochrome-1 [Iris pallida]
MFFPLLGLWLFLLWSYYSFWGFGFIGFWTSSIWASLNPALTCSSFLIGDWKSRSFWISVREALEILGLSISMAAAENMGSASKTIVWFRRDLRIEDNPALAAAAREGGVLPVFVWCPEEEGQFRPGRCSRWWLKQSLARLDMSLRSLGAPLVFVRSESALAGLLRCVGAVGATRVVYNHLYDPVSLMRDHKVKSQLVDLGIAVQGFNGDLLYDPWEVYDETGLAFTTFDAYWAKCLSLPMEPTTFLLPWKLVPPKGTENVHVHSIEELRLENDSEKSSNALLSRGWSPGWSNADKVLTEFIEEHLTEYSKNRMKVEGTTTSLLSPYLHFGEISVRKVYQSARLKQMQWAREGNSGDAEESVDLFLRSIGLREYSRYLCFHFPFTRERSLLGNLEHYPWRTDEGHFKIWRQGRTGYPLVDAGMRELWATGWTHNRIRVVTSSFCVKFLLLPWTWGMQYFWDTLLDSDMESDILGWQYISGSLPDGHELNRLDSPEAQGRSFDPDGEYVRTWLPELARLPSEWIHNPGSAPSSVLKAAGVELGSNYPRPIVDINTARERLDDAVATMWELDRAARVAELNGSEEVVADNLVSMKILDIPKVVVKKELSASTSYLDQRVPSVQLLNSSLCGKGLKDVNGKKPIEVEADNYGNKIETMKIMGEEDSLSTAESSSTKKRSISESSCAVPASCLSSSYGKTKYEHGLAKPQLLVGSSSVQVRQAADGDGAEKEEEAEAHSGIKGLRPCKRPA